MIVTMLKIEHSFHYNCLNYAIHENIFQDLSHSNYLSELYVLCCPLFLDIFLNL